MTCYSHGYVVSHVLFERRENVTNSGNHIKVTQSRIITGC